MSEPGTTTPIVVNASAVPDLTESQIAPLVSAIGGVVIAFGLMSGTKWAALAGVLPYLIMAVWRAYRAVQKHNQRVVMATAAPDAVAHVVNRPQ